MAPELELLVHHLERFALQRDDLMRGIDLCTQSGLLNGGADHIGD